MGKADKDTELKVIQVYLRNIGVVHIQTNGAIKKIYNPSDAFSGIGTHIDIEYKEQIKTEKLHFNVSIDDTYLELDTFEIRCKTISGRQMAPDILEERFVRDPMHTSALSRQLPCFSMSISCKACRTLIISYDNTEIKRFIDIPESNWEEYMDLWHCHKPTDNQTYNDEVNNVYNLLQNNRNSIIPKVDLPILLSDISLLVYPKTMHLERCVANDDFACKQCGNKIGKVRITGNQDDYDSYLELYKPELSLAFNHDNKNVDIFEVSPLDWLANEMLYCTSMYGSRMFKLIPPSGLKKKFDVIYIWCLDHGISIGINESKFDNLLKAMYTKQNILNHGTQNVQDIEINYGDDEYNTKFYLNLIEELEKSENKVSLNTLKNELNGWLPLYI
ncbi:hypothetical protein FOG50_02221 [Hanseniaspora uvarum]|nr:hypothetical protein FOG50_02221 [Hanseniaspora uvarum]